MDDMAGTLDDVLCLICGRFPCWAKVDFYRADGAFDWRLDVWCGCGEVKDPAVLDRARADYLQKYRHAAQEAQERFLDEALTPEVNELFDRILDKDDSSLLTSQRISPTIHRVHPSTDQPNQLCGFTAAREEDVSFLLPRRLVTKDSEDLNALIWTAGPRP